MKRILFILEKLKYKLYTLTHNKIKFDRTDLRKIYLFGSAEYMNYGDIAISSAEVSFLSHEFPDSVVIEVPERLIFKCAEDVKKHINDHDVIVFQGGGNMGDIWPEQEKMRQFVFHEFKSHKIVSFPQSVGYTSVESDNLKKTISVARDAKDITFFLRDINSFNFVKENFPANVKVSMSPDIVLTLDETSDEVGRSTSCTAFLRRDKERERDSRVNELLKHISENYTVEMSDTVGDNWKIVNAKTRPKLLTVLWNQFRSTDVVVTDRLHGMIFSVITNTPVIVFDNNNHKIRNFYNTWLKEIPSILFVKDETDEDIYETFLEFKDTGAKNDLSEIRNSFRDLIKSLGSI